MISLSFNMHDAFEADPILDKLPLGIESIACYGRSKSLLKRLPIDYNLLSIMLTVIHSCFKFKIMFIPKQPSTVTPPVSECLSSQNITFMQGWTLDQ